VNYHGVKNVRKGVIFMGISSLNHWVESNLFIIIVATLFVIILLFMWIILLNKRLKKYRILFKNQEGKDLETVLVNVSEQVNTFKDTLNKLEDRFASNQISEERHFQNWNLVRFKAFQNTGGDQSFALAVLDGLGNGYVMSSIFGREESRVYCKPVQAGVSNYPLSEEEQEAIEKALGEIKTKKGSGKK